MTVFDTIFISSEDKKILSKFISMFQQCGNKQRALSSILCLFSKLKQGLAGYPIVSKYPLHTLDEKNPIQLLHKCLYNIKPAFYIRRIIRSGKRYDLPVPISENRALFMAIDWLRKTILKNNKNDLDFTTLLAQEISAALYREGSSKDFLKAYIDIALDQRPFGRFIRRKRNTISKSTNTIVATRLEQAYQNIRRTVQTRKHHNIGITRKINMHNIRKNLNTKKLLDKLKKKQKPKFRSFRAKK